MPAGHISELSLVVGVLTFRRPGDLAEGLPLILDQLRELEAQIGIPVRGSVLVVDNDPGQSAREAVAGLRADPAIGELLRYTAEATPGIAAARNRALSEASGARLLVFIDDDERPHPGWLLSLVHTWLDTRATAVMGRVISKFTGELDPWVAAGDFFRRRSMPTGTEIAVAAAGNLLLDLEQVTALGVRFDERIGLAAGEDSLFSRQLVARGGRIVWCEESEATDVVPPERMTRRWVLTRAWSHGNHESIVELHLSEGPMRRAGLRLRGIARGILRLGGGGARYLFGVLTGSRRHQARGLRTAYRGAGIVAGSAGFAYEEYGRPS